MSELNEITGFIILGFMVCAIPICLIGLYLLSKKYPEISRELHNTNCNCNVCYPKENVL